MGNTYLAAVDSEFAAGETISVTVTIDDYPASDGYALEYFFQGPDGARFSASGAASGDNYVVSAEYQVTEDLPPGTYYYTGYATLSGTRTAVDVGQITLLANPRRVTWAAEMLSAVQALIKGRASDDQRTKRIGEVELQFMTPSDLLKWEAHFRSQVDAEQSRARRVAGFGPRFILSQMVTPQ